MEFKNYLNSIKNKLTGNSKEYENAVSKMVEVIKRQRTLYNKNIREMKLAKAMALNPDNPRRKMLQDLFEDILEDAFIYGRSEARKLRISNKKIAVKEANGEINHDKTELFNKLWFNQFIKHTIDSIYLGYSLIYPKELDENGYIKKIATVFRDHIVPETTELLESPNDQTGINFTQDPNIKKWSIWINHDNFLGLLFKVAPLYIFKKHSWQNWDEFEEMFGIPMRIAKVASTDRRVKKEVDKWLRDLGSAGYARFPEGVEIDIKESQTRDSFNVFNEKRKACNEEIATLFDGHFETAKDTGSRAKSQSIINSTQKDITQDDETFVLHIINDELLPFMRRLGYPLAEDDKVIWNENVKSDPKDRLAIFKGVKDLGYKVKKEQIETELDVEIVGEYTPNKTTPPKAPKNRHHVNFNTPHNSCGCGAMEDYRVALPILNAVTELSEEEEAFLRQLYNNPDSINWHYNSFKQTNSALLDALKRGARGMDYSFDSPDAKRMQSFMDSVFTFGKDKTQAQVAELNRILKSEDIKSYSDFRKQVKHTFPQYNEHYLRTEYDHAMSVSQMAARQQEMMDNIDSAPYWRFSAIIDDSTTGICKELDGRVFRKDDKKAFKFLPPLHWKCRSDAEDVLEDYEGEVLSFNEAIKIDPKEWGRMQKQGFDVNWGDSNQVFTKAQTYLKKLPEGTKPIDTDSLTFGDFGLSKTHDLHKHKVSERISKIKRYIDQSGMARVISVQDLPIWVNAEQLKLSNQDFTRLKETLEQPDEIYWHQSGEQTSLSFFRFYEDSTIKVDTKGIKVSGFHSLSSDIDKQRRGLLVYTPKEHIRYYKSVYKKYDKTWRKAFFNEQNGGYVVINKNRIAKSKISKNEIKKLEKETRMALNYAQYGYRIEILDELPGISSPDALCNGIPIDFKSVKSPDKIVKHAKKAIHQQGADMVLFEFEKESSEIYKALLKLKKRNIKALYYFKGKKGIYNNF